MLKITYFYKAKKYTRFVLVKKTLAAKYIQKNKKH